MCKLVSLLLLVALSVAAGACTQQSLPRAAFTDDGDYLPPQSGPGLVARDRSPIPDVPLPIGFVAVPSRSEARIGASAREVRHVYQGRSNTAEVVNFYRQHLPRHGWSSQGRERDADGTTVMRYTKGPESLRVRIGERHSVVTTIVTLGPRN
ncbi:MAG: hypothetical protein WD534_00515 [Phycisphaeraceae bacterium]